MLAWLHAAFSHEAEVESYRETTEGVLSPLPEGRFWVSEVILKPRATFASYQQVKPFGVAPLPRTIGADQEAYRVAPTSRSTAAR